MTQYTTHPDRSGYGQLRRAAHHLQNLASFDQLAVFMFWIFATVALYSDIGATSISPVSLHDWAEELRVGAGNAAILFIPLVLAPEVLAAIWLLSRLRMLAGALNQDEPISFALSKALAALARAILAYLVIATFLAPVMAELMGASGYPLALNFGSWYLGLIAYLGLRAMSLLVTEASRINDENKAFV